VASEAARARRQRELELEVLTGTVRGWEGEPIDQVINTLLYIFYGQFHYVIVLFIVANLICICLQKIVSCDISKLYKLI
jgi:hypothetical protein